MKEQDFFEKYPLCFSDHDKPMSQTCMCWGLDIGKGWYALLDEACAKIEPILERMKQEAISHIPTSSQVKEKMGTLRWYWAYYSDEIDEIVQAAEDKSAVTCEECGVVGELRCHHNWYLTRCDTCFEDYLKHRHGVKE